MKPFLFQVWAPDGSCQYEGPAAPSPTQLTATGTEREILERLLGGSRSGPRIRPAQVKQYAEQLGFLSSEGCLAGFFNVLPRGAIFDRCVEKFNREHIAALNAVQIEFPMVFDLASAQMEELTRGYERNERMFRLASPDQGKRLAYAADPGLFNWLQNRVLADERLPFAIMSPLPAMRRWRSGEVGDLDHIRQYPLMDLHTITGIDDALDSYLANTALGAVNTRFWVDEDWVVFADVTAEFLTQRPDIGSRIAKAANKWLLIKAFPAPSNYYAMRSGIMVDASYADVMMYNAQWDEQNPQRFNISSSGGKPVVILHGNMLTGWPLLLPVLLGRKLSGVMPKGFPVEVAPVQVAVLPVEDRHIDAAREWVAGHPHLRSSILYPPKSLGNRLKEAHDSLCPAFIVLGDREIQSGGKLTYTVTREQMDGDDFPEEVRKRIERCAPDNYLPEFTDPFSGS